MIAALRDWWGLIKPVLIGGVAAFAVWWAYDWAYDRGAASRQAEVDRITARAEAAEAANQANALTISELETANAGFAERMRYDEEQAARAVASLQQETERLQGELQRARGTRRIIYQGDEHAKSWADTPVPVAVMRSLRDDQAAHPD